MPVPVDVTLLLTGAVLAFAAAIQMTSGFGFALVAVPLLALVTGPHAAILLALLSGTVFNAWQAVEGRGHRDTGVVARLLGGAVLGLPLGYAAFRVIEPDPLTVIIGVLVLLAVAVLALGPPFPAVSRPMDVATGALTGLLTTSTGTNGPPIVTLLQARRLPPREFRATVTLVFLVLNLAAIAVFAVTGTFTWEVLGTALRSVPALVVGGWLGYRARTWVPPAAFRRLVLGLLTVAGATAVLAGL